MYDALSLLFFFSFIVHHLAMMMSTRIYAMQLCILLAVMLYAFILLCNVFFDARVNDDDDNSNNSSSTNITTVTTTKITLILITFIITFLFQQYVGLIAIQLFSMCILHVIIYNAYRCLTGDQ